MPVYFLLAKRRPSNNGGTWVTFYVDGFSYMMIQDLEFEI